MACWSKGWPTFSKFGVHGPVRYHLYRELFACDRLVCLVSLQETCEGTCPTALTDGQTQLCPGVHSTPRPDDLTLSSIPLQSLKTVIDAPLLACSSTDPCSLLFPHLCPAYLICSFLLLCQHLASYSAPFSLFL